MNDSGQACRKSYFDALNGQVNIPGSPGVYVPIVDEKLDLNITEHDLYMLIGGQAANPKENKTMWAMEEDIAIEIVNRRRATNSKTLVEDISQQTLTILLPTRTTNGLSVASPFRLTYARLISSQYEFLQTKDGWQISKKLIFRNHITQS